MADQVSRSEYEADNIEFEFVNVEAVEDESNSRDSRFRLLELAKQENHFKSMGLSLFKLGKYEEAATYFSRAIVSIIVMKSMVKKSNVLITIFSFSRNSIQMLQRTTSVAPCVL